MSTSVKGTGSQRNRTVPLRTSSSSSAKNSSTLREEESELNKEQEDNILLKEKSKQESPKSTSSKLSEKKTTPKKATLSEKLAVNASEREKEEISASKTVKTRSIKSKTESESPPSPTRRSSPRASKSRSFQELEEENIVVTQKQPSPVKTQKQPSPVKTQKVSSKKISPTISASKEELPIPTPPVRVASQKKNKLPSTSVRPSEVVNVISNNEPLLIKAEEVEEELKEKPQRETAILIRSENEPSVSKKSKRSAIVKDVITPQSRKEPTLKSSKLSTEIKKSSGFKTTTPTELDVKFNKMGITPLYTLYVDADEIEEVGFGSTIIAMTPLGTVIGIRLNAGESITQAKNTYINVRRIQGLMQLEQSWLTALSQKTDVSTIVVCKDGACLMTRNEFGKIESDYFQIDTRQLTGEISTPESPTAYPLVNYNEILTHYNMSSDEGDVNLYESYIAFLTRLKNESDDVNIKQVEQRVGDLDSSIEFMQSLLANIQQSRDKIVEFNTANIAESSTLSEQAKELLKLKMSDMALSEQNIKAWRQNQERLSSLTYNNMAIINGMKSFNKFREYLEDLDRDTFSLFFSLYSRVLTTMDNPDNLNLRMPSSWALDNVLIRTTSVLNGEDSSIEKVKIAVSEDLSNYNINNFGAETNVLVSHFKNAFYT